MKRSYGIYGLLCLSLAVSSAVGAERPTLNKTRDPRPDILPHPIYYAHTEYRLAHNRPRYVSGWIAHYIAPSSQEAMVWCENVHAGRYAKHHAPPVYKRYFAPKPWEILQVGARPDFVTVEEDVVLDEPVEQFELPDIRPVPVEPVPLPLEDASPSDN